jgi:TonB-like protein
VLPPECELLVPECIGIPNLLCYKSPMRVYLLLLLSCLGALPLLAQDKPSLPAVSAFDCPQYPSLARSVRIQGLVHLRVTTDGHAVSDVKLTSGHPVLAPEAIKNVRTWKFVDHAPAEFSVDYFYVFQGKFKREKATKCDAKLELPTKVTVSTTLP